MKTLYLVRHCAAAGQAPGDPLTPEGRMQAEALADHLTPCGIRRIVSGPYRRAMETAAPLAARLGLVVETDDRLVERVLCAGGHPDWREMLRASFADPDRRYEGGESGREASERGVAVLHEVLEHPVAADGATMIVTHGNLLALLLRRQDPAFGFDQWAAMTCPDVYRATVTVGRVAIERIPVEDGVTAKTMTGDRGAEA
jgi:2,3-bisphosphoglycerate-dependent phosphoglycerate mutase